MHFTNPILLATIHKSIKIVVEKINKNILSMAAGTGSNRGTGGMITKLQAADYATKRGVEVHVINGSNPENLYEIFDGNNIGTMFLATNK